jgi:hypothetical protein
LDSDRFLEQLKLPKHPRHEEQGNIFQASAFHSKDVQGKPYGGSTRRCVQFATYFNVVIKNPFIENIFFFTWDTKLLFAGLGSPAGDCCREVSRPNKV